MKGYKKWGAFTLIVGMVMLCSSCAVHRHTRPHRHHPHRHRVVIIANRLPPQSKARMVSPLKNVWL